MGAQTWLPTHFLLNPSIWEVEQGWLKTERVGGQPGQYCEFQASLGRKALAYVQFLSSQLPNILWQLINGYM